MPINATPVSRMTLRRGGGTIIKARMDIWQQDNADQPMLVATKSFDKVLEAQEAVSLQLQPGKYTCVVQCFVQESLNGVFRVELDVDGQTALSGNGDVNVTPARDDAKVFRGQFTLVVAP